MNRKRLLWIVNALAALVFAASITTQAQAPLPYHLTGIISDYTPLIPSLNPTGPWEMRGHWSLHLNRDTGKADFSAFMTMELSDSGVVAAGKNMTDAASRSPHTHHVLMTGAKVSTEPVDLASCPTFSPTNTPKLVVNGPANFISGNGNSAPFEKLGPTRLQVCISGGTDGTSEVIYSNMTLAMMGPAADKHFGAQPIHGVVRFVRSSDGEDEDGR